jgi:hypothetical protein
MGRERMQRIQYDGDCWDGPAVHPALWGLLLQKDLLIEFSTGAPPYQVILGVPHHAAPRVDRIAEHWANPATGERGRPADETTGLMGLAALAALRQAGIAARLVIAAHPTDHDPNKTAGCPYWESLFAGRLPDLLLELHGAGKDRNYDLELSAGRNRLADPLRFGERLAARLPAAWTLAVQKHPGTRAAYLLHADHGAGNPEDGRLENPALATLSLSHAGDLGTPALHLEMKAFLRQPDAAYPHAPRPTPDAWRLAGALAGAVQENLRRPGDRQQPAAPRPGRR